MVERLGPNMARTLVGDAYNPDFRYELETNEDGFHLITIDTASGDALSVKLNPETTDPLLLTPIWRSELSERLPKKPLASALLFWLCTLTAGACVVAAFCGQF